jgi:hypothetical protein
VSEGRRWNKDGGFPAPMPARSLHHNLLLISGCSDLAYFIYESPLLWSFEYCRVLEDPGLGVDGTGDKLMVGDMAAGKRGS